MIFRYNTFQLIKAVFSFIVGLLCFAVAYLFFRYAPSFVSSQFDYALPPLWTTGFAVFCMVVLTVSGFRTWKKGGGLHSYHESSLYHNLGFETAGAWVVERYTHRVTGPAYVLSQIFMAGPLLVLRTFSLLKSLIPNSLELEMRLKETLAVLLNADKWQSLDEYPAVRTEILYLVQMGLVGFSSHKGLPKIKANK